MLVTKLVILKAVEVVFEGGKRELLMPSDEPQSVPSADAKDLIERKLAQKPGTKSRKKAAPKTASTTEGDIGGDEGATEDDDDAGQASGAE